MKVRTLTVNGTKSEYEINETETVLSFKEKIGKAQCLKPERIRLFYHKKSTGLFSYFLGDESILLRDDNQPFMDLNYKEGDSFIFAIKFGSDDEIKDNQTTFYLNGEQKTFDSHEILNINYEQFKHKFNIPESEDVEFSYKFNCFKDKYPSISYKKFNKNMNDIGNGDIKCIVKINDKDIEIGLPENSIVRDLKLKLFNYFDDLKRPFYLDPLVDIKFFDKYTMITYSPDSPDKIMKFEVKLY